MSLKLFIPYCFRSCFAYWLRCWKFFVWIGFCCNPSSHMHLTLLVLLFIKKWCLHILTFCEYPKGPFVIPDRSVEFDYYPRGPHVLCLFKFLIAGLNVLWMYSPTKCRIYSKMGCVVSFIPLDNIRYVIIFPYTINHVKHWFRSCLAQCSACWRRLVVLTLCHTSHNCKCVWILHC